MLHLLRWPRGLFRRDHQIPQGDVDIFEWLAKRFPTGDALHRQSLAAFFGDDGQFVRVKLMVQVVVGVDVVVAAADPRRHRPARQTYRWLPGRTHAR